jgi:hypothetical protein
VLNKTLRVSARGKIVANRQAAVNLSPSIAGLPSRPDPREPSPERLEQIIRDLPLKKGGEDNSAADARELFEGYAVASWARVQQKKAGTASLIGQARDLKKIASKSSTLLKLLKRADRKTFEAWAKYPEGIGFNTATQEWLQLKQLLEITAERATASARKLESITRKDRSAARKGTKRVRPIRLGDLVTIEAANIYERRTGKHAVRSIGRDSGKPFGDFHNFLVRVFEVLEIKSSPDARNMQLQAELRGMK